MPRLEGVESLWFAPSCKPYSTQVVDQRRPLPPLDPHRCIATHSRDMRPYHMKSACPCSQLAVTSYDKGPDLVESTMAQGRAFGALRGAEPNAQWSRGSPCVIGYRPSSGALVYARHAGEGPHAHPPGLEVSFSRLV